MMSYGAYFKQNAAAMKTNVNKLFFS